MKIKLVTSNSYLHWLNISEEQSRLFFVVVPATPTVTNSEVLSIRLKIIRNLGLIAVWHFWSWLPENSHLGKG